MTNVNTAFVIANVVLLVILDSVQSFAPPPPPYSFPPHFIGRQSLILKDATSSSDNDSATSTSTTTTRDVKRQELLDLLEAVPRNAATSRRQTDEILDCVRQLEPLCPTADSDVLSQSAGTWELLWTAQEDEDGRRRGGGGGSGEATSTAFASPTATTSTPLSFFRWINPLENQAYSNNPSGGGGGGRSNPVLPLPMQEFLTNRGILRDDGSNDEPAPASSRGRTSTQTVDVKNGRVINVVSLPLSRGMMMGGGGAATAAARPASLTVRVDFTPHAPDPRRVNVKFRSFSVALTGEWKLDLPLGLIGPTGWLRTTFLDDSLRITRGHKGSVFVLKRRGQRDSPD